MSSYTNNPRYKELTWKIHHAVNALNEYPDFIDELEIEKGEYVTWHDLYIGWYDWAMENLTLRSRIKLYLQSKKLRLR